VPIADLAFYALAVPAVLVTGVSKGGFGVGLGILAVPIMALRIPAAQAAAIMLPILCLMDLVGLRGYRARWDRTNMRIIVPAGLAGIAIATLAASIVSARAFALLVGLVAVGFSLDHWLRGRVPRPAAGPSVVKGSFWAALSGFTSFVAHAGGPPLSVYLLPQRLDKTLFVGTTIVFFAVVNYVKLVPYAWLGQFDRSTLLTTLVLAPLAPLGMQLGMWLHRRLDPKPFYRICYLFVFLAGLKLIADGVR
jgi:uncharacterized membrane protein YfcA